MALGEQGAKVGFGRNDGKTTRDTGSEGLGTRTGGGWGQEDLLPTKSSTSESHPVLSGGRFRGSVDPRPLDIRFTGRRSEGITGVGGGGPGPRSGLLGRGCHHGQSAGAHQRFLTDSGSAPPPPTYGLIDPCPRAQGRHSL